MTDASADMRCGNCQYWDRLNRSRQGDCMHPTYRKGGGRRVLGMLVDASPKVTKSSFSCPFWANSDHGIEIFGDSHD